MSATKFMEIENDNLKSEEPTDVKNYDENVEEMDTFDGDIVKTENIFKMVDIVGLLLERMDSKTLKPSLMVSKLWNKEGMKSFVKNHFIQVPLDLYLESDSELELEDQVKDKIKIIEELSNSIPFLKLMKIPNVLINKPDDIEIFQRLQILDQVKKVKLNRKKMTREEYIECMRKIVNTCPSLKFLGMERLYNYDNEYDEDLIKLCVDLQKIGPFTISDLFVSICWGMDDDEFKTTSKFVNSGVGIITLELITYLEDIKKENEFLNRRISNFVRKILESSKNCLKTLKLNTCDVTWSSIKNIPVMRQLETLDMEIITMPKNTVLFPPCFQFQSNCPNLKCVNFQLESQSEENIHVYYLNQIFATTGSAPSVKSLDFHCYHPIKLDKLFQTFNHLEYLYMGYEKFIIIRPLWKYCRTLKILKFSLEEPDEFTYIEFLAQLTGHCLDFVERAWFSFEDLKFETIPTPFHPSIVELQDLETLTIFGGRFEGLNLKFKELAQQLALDQIKTLKKIEVETSWR